MEKSRKISLNFGAKGWSITIYSLLIFLFVYLWENGLNYIIPAYAGEFGWNATLMYGYQTIGYVIGCVGMLFMGIVIRKKGPKPVLMITLAIGLVAILLIANATTLPVYTVGAIVFPACSCIFCWQCVGAFAANWFPTKKGLFMGIVTIGIVASVFLVNLVLFPMMNVRGNSSIMYVIFILGIALFIYAFFGVKSSPEDWNAYPDNDRSISYDEVKKRNMIGVVHRQTSPWNDYRKCLKSPAVWAITITTGLVLLIQRGCMASMVPAIMSFGHSQQMAATLMTYSGLLAFVFSFLGGVVDTKVGTKKAMTICCIAGVIASLVFAFFSGSAPMILIGLLVLGYAGSAGNNYQASYTAEVFGRYDFDTPWSLIIFMSTALSSFGYVAVSAIGNSAGYVSAYIFCAVMSASATVISIVYKAKYLGRKELDQAEIDRLYEELKEKEMIQ